MSPTEAKRRLMTCASSSELPCDNMSPTEAKRRLMTCASSSELPCKMDNAEHTKGNDEDAQKHSYF